MALVVYAQLEPGSPRIPTHIEVEGTVGFNKKEADGDRHIRLQDGDKFITVECVPELPEISAQCKAVKKGQRIKVRGIARYDGAPGHGWQEVHPVLGIGVVP